MDDPLSQDIKAAFERLLALEQVTIDKPGEAFLVRSRMQKCSEEIQKYVERRLPEAIALEDPVVRIENLHFLLDYTISAQGALMRLFNPPSPQDPNKISQPHKNDIIDHILAHLYEDSEKHSETMDANWGAVLPRRLPSTKKALLTPEPHPTASQKKRENYERYKNLKYDGPSFRTP